MQATSACHWTRAPASTRRRSAMKRTASVRRVRAGGYLSTSLRTCVIRRREWVAGGAGVRVGVRVPHLQRLHSKQPVYRALAEWPSYAAAAP